MRMFARRLLSASFIVALAAAPVAWAGTTGGDKQKDKDKKSDKGKDKDKAGAKDEGDGDDGNAAAREQKFKSWDKNRDGFLSLDEFKDQGGHPGNFASFDRNRDGRLTKDEFVHRP